MAKANASPRLPGLASIGSSAAQAGGGDSSCTQPAHAPPLIRLQQRPHAGVGRQYRNDRGVARKRPQARRSE